MPGSPGGPVSPGNPRGPYEQNSCKIKRSTVFIKAKMKIAHLLTRLPLGPSSPGIPLVPGGPAAPEGPASPFSPTSPLEP